VFLAIGGAASFFVILFLPLNWREAWASLSGIGFLILLAVLVVVLWTADRET
jgi:hypothetical protein